MEKKYPELIQFEKAPVVNNVPHDDRFQDIFVDVPDFGHKRDKK